MYEELLRYAEHVRSKVDKFMLEILRGEPKTLYDASTHLIRAGGKRLRPLLLILSCRVVGGSEDIAIPAAAAVEIFHNFTLVHDDIIDRDEFRRGVPTVHTKWGVDTAILAGDLLFAKAFDALCRLPELGVPPERVVKAVKLLTWASVTVAEGQMLDMEFEKRVDVTESEYMGMIEKKTAALFMASSGIGAVIGGGSEDDIRNLMEFSRHMGIAFQIRDDILGLVGDERVLGKPVLSDIREGKRTILVIYALSKLDEENKKRLLRILGNRNASIEELREAAELIKSTGAIEYAEKLAEEHVSKSLSYLDRVKVVDEHAKHLLKLLNSFVTRRRY